MEVTTPDRFAESDARGLVRAFCAVVALVASGCAVGIVGEQSADKMQCRVPVLKCPPVPSPLTISTLQPTPAPGSSCYQQQAGSISGAQLYCDPGNFTVLGSSDPGLAGASLVQTRQADSGSTAAQHFVFRPTPVSGTSPLGELFVAYDSRATVAPAWLSADFVPVVNPLDGSNHTLRTTFPDRTAGAPAGQTVDLDLYKRRVATAAELAIPGNSAGNPQFPAGLTVADRAMYVVLLKPRTRPGPCGVNAHSLHVAEDCYAVPRVGGAFDLAFISQMQTKAVASCNEVFSQLPAFQCAVPQAECLRIGSCPADQAKTSPLSVPANRFLRHSEVVFEPATSLARVQVQGRHYVRAVSGRLHFEPEFDAGQLLQKLSVRSIALSIGSIGGFEDLSLVLGSPFDAACADSPPLVASPCDRYRIAPGAMEAELGARQDGQWTVASGTNLAMSILVDHTQRSFRLRGGPVRAAVEVDGDPATVELLVDLTGRFENFAPVADTRESKAHSECVEGRNRDPIVLDAAGSFDIYASLPPTAYEWWEDYAQLGERFLGAGSRVTLWPRHLDFGLHHMTLAVEDSAGVVSTDSLIVQVLDSEPPFIAPPPTVYALATTGAPFRVDLGEAAASDTCSDRVFVRHDGPADSRFPAGLSTVVWTADDAHGNTSTASQEVYVFSVPEQAPGEVVERLRLEVREAVADVEDCRALSSCRSELEGAKILLQWLVALPAAVESGWLPILGAVAEQVEVAADALQGDEDAGADLVLDRRSTAVDSLLTALEALDRIDGP